jgi:hypothetical protein
MRGAIPPLPQYVFMAWCLVKHRDNFTFLLYFYFCIYKAQQEKIIKSRSRISDIDRSSRHLSFRFLAYLKERSQLHRFRSIESYDDFER